MERNWLTTLSNGCAPSLRTSHSLIVAYLIQLTACIGQALVDSELISAGET